MDRSKLAERKAPDGFAKFKSYPVGMQVSYCVDSEMLEEGTVYGVEKVSGQSAQGSGFA